MRSSERIYRWLLRLWSALKQDLRYAVRTLLRAPTFTATVVATLALGIGANPVIFSAVDAVLLSDAPVSDSDSLVEVYTSSGNNLYSQSSYPDYFDLRDSGTFASLDAGSGIVGVGATLHGIMNIPIVLTHYHWDHVQGLPFFSPLYRPGRAVTVWAPALGRQVADIETMFESPFFPVPYDRLPSRPAIRMYGGGHVAINGFDVSAHPLNHPGGSFAYRIGGANGDLVYATDHGFGNADIDLALAHFSRGARVLIVDSHFTPEEMPAHKGWGHNDWSQCGRFAADCGAEQLRLFHHKPGRPDGEMREIERAAQRIFAETRAAKEGDSFLV